MRTLLLAAALAAAAMSPAVAANCCGKAMSDGAMCSRPAAKGGMKANRAGMGCCCRRMNMSKRH